VDLNPIDTDAIRGTALFYPCCGRDVDTPVRLFAHAVTAFYFVDQQTVGRPSPRQLPVVQLPRDRSPELERYVDRASQNKFEVHRWKCRGEEAFARLPNLGVFFHRGDTLADGEGSSGVPWLGSAWLTMILSKIVSGGFLVTDGSNCPSDGPAELRMFHGQQGLEARAVAQAQPFAFAGRHLSCVGYAGERYGPTLIWRVSP